MKTKLNITLLAAAAMLSLHSIASAQTPARQPAGLQPIDYVILQLMTDGSIVGNTGADRLRGGMDDDQLHGNDGDDTITGSAGADSLRSRRTANAITGDGGADIYGEGGADSLRLPVNRGLVGHPLGVICGGGDADFLVGIDQLSADPAAWPVRLVNGLITTEPGDGKILTEKPTHGLITTNPGEGSILIEKPANGLIQTEPGDGHILIEKPTHGLIQTNPGDGSILFEKPVYRRFVTDPRSIVGGDSFTGDPMEEDALFQLIFGIRGYAGADELWGDNGTDSAQAPKK